MKKNGFTLIELIAVLVIISIIALLAAPNIITLMQSTKEKSFISEVNEMLSTATYMHKTTKATTINMRNLTGTIPVTDPYGYTYVLDADESGEFSYFTFIEPDSSADPTAMTQRKVKVFIKSCKTDDSGRKCHYVCKGENQTKMEVTDNCSIS